MPALFGGLRKDAVQVLIRYQDRWPTVFQKIAQLVPLGEGIDNGDHGIGLEGRPKRHDRFHRVVTKYNDPIAPLNARLNECIGQGIGLRVEFGVGETLLHANQSDFVRERERAVLQIVVQKGHGTVKGLHISALLL
jgi:hypothetical protein